MLADVRADRLLSLLLLLQHRGRRSAKELADELEVSTRTVLRDIEALSTAGVPVYAERGRHGGFALLPGYSTDLTGLTHDEALALLVAGSRGDGAGMAPALASAMRKVVAGLPAAQRESAGRNAGRILVRDGRWLPLATSGTGDCGVRDGEERTYRLSRVREVRERADQAVRSPDVDLDAAWRARRTAFLASLPTLPVEVRVRASRRGDLLRTAGEVLAEGAAADGWLRLTVAFGDAVHAERVLWSMAVDVEVLAPAELRATLAARAEAVAARYRG